MRDEMTRQSGDRWVAIATWGRSEGARIWIALGALAVVSALFAPGTLTGRALLAMLPIASVLAVAAIGQSLTIQQGGIDFAVAGAMTLSAVLVTGLANSEDGKLPMAVIAALVAVMLAGLLSGIAITLLRITPIIATLAVNALIFGAVSSYASGSPKQAPPALSTFAIGRTLGIPNTVWIASAFLALALVIQTRMVVGRRFISIGENPAAAHAMGLRVATYVIGTYIASATCYGVAGIMLAGYVVSPGLAVGTPYLLSTITAVVIGGTAFGGGRARLVGTAVAAVFLSQLNSLLNALGAPPSSQYLVEAAAIAVAVGLGPVWTKLIKVRLPRVAARKRSLQLLAGAARQGPGKSAHAAWSSLSVRREPRAWRAVGGGDAGVTAQAQEADGQTAQRCRHPQRVSRSDRGLIFSAGDVTEPSGACCRIGGAVFRRPPPQNRACHSSRHTAQAAREGGQVPAVCAVPVSPPPGWRRTQ
jgi:ribose transport system permease protein